MLPKKFNRCLLAMAITTQAMAADFIVFDEQFGQLELSGDDSVLITGTGRLVAPDDAISIETANSRVEFIRMEVGGSLQAGLSGINTVGDGITINEISFAGDVLAGLGSIDASGISIGENNFVNGDIIFTDTSTFLNVTGGNATLAGTFPCQSGVNFCAGGAAVATQATHVGDILLQGNVRFSPNGVILGGYEIDNEVVEGTRITGNIANSGTLNAVYGFTILSGATVTGDVRNDANGVINSPVGMLVTSERIQYDFVSADGAVGVTLGTQVNINGSIINAGAINDIAGFPGIGIQISNDVVITGDINNSGIISSDLGIFVSQLGLSETVFAETGAVFEIDFQDPEGNGTAPQVGPAPVIMGDILNSGTINSEQVGISIIQGATVTGGIINSENGSIASSESFAIFVQDSSVGSIENSGSLSTDRDIAIHAVNSTIARGINNIGGITADSNIAIDLAGVTISSGGITNSGSITGDDAGIVVLGNTMLSGLVIGDSTIAGGIINSGTIASENGFTLFLEGTRVDRIVNSGLLTSNVEAVINLRAASVTDGINNTGVINAASNRAIVLEEGATVSGGINNSGAIISDDTGIELDGSSLSDGINNTTAATITSGEGAIVLNGANLSGGINNDGVLTTNGNRYYSTVEIGLGLGIDGTTITGGSFTGGINNTSNGQILNTATTALDFVHYDRNPALLIVASIDGGIDNDGLIQSNTDDAVLIFNVSRIDGLEVPVTVLSDGIDNAGVILSNGGVAIHSTGATINGGIINSNTIEGKEGIVISGLQFAQIEVLDPLDSSNSRDEISGVSINANAGVTGDINNSGLIRSTIGAAEITANPLRTGSGNVGALTVLYGASISGDIINTGNIEATGSGVGISVGSGSRDLSSLNVLVDGGINGLPLTEQPASSVVGVINNSGDISSLSNIAIHVDNGSLGGIINNSGATISGGNGLAIQAELVSAQGTQGSTIGFVTNAGAINGSVDFGSGGGTYNALGGTSGSVIGATTVNIQLAAGATSDTTSQINGDFVFSGPITVSAKGVDSSADNNVVSGVLAVSGAVDVTGSSLAIEVSGESFIANNTELEFLTADSLISDITSVLDNSLVIDFDITQQGNSLVAIAKRTAFDEAIAETTVGAQPNVQAVSQTFREIPAQLAAGTVDDNSELVAVFNAVSVLPVEEMIAAFKSLEPEAVISSSVGAFSAGNASASAVSTRLTALRGTGFNGAVAGDEVSLSGFWMQLYDSSTDQDTIDEVDGFDADTNGIALGLDASLRGGYNIGAVFSYADTDISSNGAENNGLKIESYRLTAYGSYNAPEYFVDAQIAYALNQYEGTRNLFNGLRARNDHDGAQYSLRSRVGRPIAFDNGLFMTLKTSAEYTYLSEESYNEKGAGNAGLSVDTDTVDAFVIGAGIELAYPITGANEMIWIPELSLEVQRDLIGQEIEVDSNFVGVAAAAFTTEGANIEQTGFNLGLGLRAFNEGELSVSLRADYLYKKDYKNVSGSVTVRYGF